ncbi:MAG: hypothetical protein AAFW64_08730, partial [Pseudomonadota bacterium]
RLGMLSSISHRAQFAAPDKRLRVQGGQIGLACNYIVAKSRRVLCLRMGQAFVSRTLQMIVPNAAAYCVQDNALKAMIIAHGPVRMRRACKIGHRLFRHHSIA